jgi:hypothetical protein
MFLGDKQQHQKEYLQALGEEEEEGFALTKT